MSSIAETTFQATIIGVHLGYLAVAFGIFEKNPEYLETLDFWLKVFMASFLILRFNPFTYTRFTEFDRKVVFSTGMFLFTVTIVDTYLKTYIDGIKTRLVDVFRRQQVTQ